MALVHHAVPAVAAIALLASTGCVLPNQRHLQCRSDGDRPRPLHLESITDRFHLRNDVERAEEIGVRFGDSRRKTEGRDGEHVRQTECTDMLLTQIADRHQVSPAAVTAMRGQRPFFVDLAVFTTFAALLIGVSGSLTLTVDERLDDAVVLRHLAVATGATVLSLVGTAALILFGYAVETIRLWDGHISYRAGRLPWERHPVLAAVALFTACALGSAMKRSGRASRDGERPLRN
jgi:hypothetical protein